MTGLRYEYRALDTDGGDARGFIEAKDEADAHSKLAGKGLMAYRLRGKPIQSKRRGRGGRVRRKQLTEYLVQLSTILSANLSLLDAFSTLAKSRADPILAGRSSELLTALRRGELLSSALKDQFPEFPLYVTQLAALGETTGKLAEALADAAARMEAEDDVSSSIRTALTYPSVLMITGGTIIILMFMFVVPRFATLLGDDLSNLPVISRIVIETGLGLRSNWPILLLGVLGTIIGGLALFRNPGARDQARRIVSNIPLVGQTLRAGETANWCRTVGVAVKNKASLTAALQLGEQSTRSATFRSQLAEIRRLVRSGTPLDTAIAESIDDFDPIVVDLIRTGRESSSLGEMLLFAAKSFEKDLSERTKKLVTMIEPAAIILIAMVVGLIVVSLALAMTSLYEFEI